MTRTQMIVLLCHYRRRYGGQAMTLREKRALLASLAANDLHPVPKPLPPLRRHPPGMFFCVDRRVLPKFMLHKP